VIVYPQPMSLTHTYTVAIVDDHALFNDCMKQALEAFDFIKVVGAYTTTEGLLRNLETKQPEVIFMDISMKSGKMDGIEATKDVVKLRPQTWVVGMSMYEEVSIVNQMLGAGAKGYMSKTLSLKNIKVLFEHIEENKVFISPAHLTPGLHTPVETEVQDLPFVNKTDLTAHQLEILRLISLEKSDKEIGNLLKVPTKEIEYQKTKLAKKLGVRKVGAMIARAYDLGILPC